VTTVAIPSSQPRSSQFNKDGADGSILIVDDDEGNRYTLSRRLKRDGYTNVMVAENGVQALDLIQKHAFDLVLLDIMMPEMNGFDVLEALKGMDEAQDLPIIVISALSEIDSVARCIELGAEDYLPKPFNPVLLRARVAASLEKRRLRRMQVASFQERTKRLMELVIDGIMIMDDHGVIEAGNHAAGHMFGVGEADLTGRHLGEMILDFENQRAEDGAFDDLISTANEGLPNTRECHGQRRDGLIFPIDVGMREIHERGRRMFAVSVRDLTQRKLAEEQKLRDALYDRLTGLPNRSLLMDRLTHALQRIKRNPERRFALLFVNIDRFRVVNDSLGHSAGDTLLIEIAHRLEATLRPGDSLARVGGDEFVALAEDVTDHGGAVACAHRLQAVLGQSFVVAEQELVLSCSIGILLSSELYERAEDMLQDADVAMLRAKRSGKARHHVFQEDMRTGASRQLQVENDLRRALAENSGEVLVHYQPIIDLQRGTIAGFEALVRWNAPGRGLIPPADFIPLAEDTGLIIPLGLTVLRVACEQLVQWHKAYHPGLFMSVNVSGRQLDHPSIFEDFRAVLDMTGVDPGLVKLEVTESVVMDNPDQTEKLLHRFRNMNVGISVDDFGTGYSSLAYLHRFPIDTLKIDRSFVSAMRDKHDNLEIVRVILALAQSLRLDVVAEGVETEQELQILREFGCTFGQGYLMSRPLPPPAIEALLNTSPHW
jgi:diguanylate cyclase (GGDEF)-like protein/PAS domain S-box-containing protein